MVSIVEFGLFLIIEFKRPVAQVKRSVTRDQWHSIPRATRLVNNFFAVQIGLIESVRFYILIQEVPLRRIGRSQFLEQQFS
jgi:hypothetical protein